jgi:hypothetical protein
MFKTYVLYHFCQICWMSVLMCNTGFYKREFWYYTKHCHSTCFCLWIFSCIHNLRNFLRGTGVWSCVLSDTFTGVQHVPPLSLPPPPIASNSSCNWPYLSIRVYCYCSIYNHSVSFAWNFHCIEICPKWKNFLNEYLIHCVTWWIE